MLGGNWEPGQGREGSQLINVHNGMSSTLDSWDSNSGGQCNRCPPGIPSEKQEAVIFTYQLPSVVAWGLLGVVMLSLSSHSGQAGSRGPEKVLRQRNVGSVSWKSGHWTPNLGTTMSVTGIDHDELQQASSWIFPSKSVAQGCQTFRFLRKSQTFRFLGETSQFQKC